MRDRQETEAGQAASAADGSRSAGGIGAAARQARGLEHRRFQLPLLA
jgi:hypothetical protein